MALQPLKNKPSFTRPIDLSESIFVQATLVEMNRVLASTMFKSLSLTNIFFDEIAAKSRVKELTIGSSGEMAGYSCDVAFRQLDEMVISLEEDEKWSSFNKTPVRTKKSEKWNAVDFDILVIPAGSGFIIKTGEKYHELQELIRSIDKNAIYFTNQSRKLPRPGEREYKTRKVAVSSFEEKYLCSADRLITPSFVYKRLYNLAKQVGEGNESLIDEIKGCTLSGTIPVSVMMANAVAKAKLSDSEKLLAKEGMLKIIQADLDQIRSIHANTKSAYKKSLIEAATFIAHEINGKETLADLDREVIEVMAKSGVPPTGAVASLLMKREGNVRVAAELSLAAGYRPSGGARAFNTDIVDITMARQYEALVNELYMKKEMNNGQVSIKKSNASIL